MVSPELAEAQSDAAILMARAWREQLEALKAGRKWAFLPGYEFHTTTPAYPNRDDAWEEFYAALNPDPHKRVPSRRRLALTARRIFLANLGLASQENTRLSIIGDISYKLTTSPIDPMVFKLESMFPKSSGRLFVGENVGVERAGQLNRILHRNPAGLRDIILNFSSTK